MDNFRIRKETMNGASLFFVEKRIFGFIWVDLFPDFNFGSIGFKTYEEAVKNLLEKIKKPEKVQKPEIEYLPIVDVNL